MKTRRTLGLTATLLALGVAPAFAQDDDIVQQPDRVEYKKKTIIDFSDVTIQGELTKPEGSYILNRKKTKFRSLLKIRGNFLPGLADCLFKGILRGSGRRGSQQRGRGKQQTAGDNQQP